jgi:anaerobic selenocysteine-containing dehydrogenase
VAVLLKGVDPRLKAFEFAQETTKQLLTLATGIVALTITFLHDLAANAPSWSVYVLAVGWFAYLISMVAGVLTLMTLTGNVGNPTCNVYEKNTKETARAQFLAFVAGTLLTIVFGVAAAHRIA